MMADEKKVLRLLKTARGQMDGIIKMVEENRYCIDISQQLMATEAILNRANKEILAAHLKHCVQEAASDAERGQKIDEFVSTLGQHLEVRAASEPSRILESLVNPMKQKFNVTA